MSDSGPSSQNQELMQKATEVTIRLVVIAALMLWCFLIFRPFLVPVLWGVILAVALSPLFERLRSMLGGRTKLAATVFMLVGLGALVIPVWFLSESFLDGVRWMKDEQHKESIRVPPPPASVADWPLIGEPLFESWTEASEDLEKTVVHFAPQLKQVGQRMLGLVTGIGAGLLLTALAIILAAVMLVHAEGGGHRIHQVGHRLGGDPGAAAVDLSVQAIRSVANGVVGVAAIQSLLAALGLFLAGVPAAGLWAVFVLVLAVAQLPPLVIMGPAAIYVIATSDSTLTIVLFSIWAVLVSISDTFLKPLLLGRGMDIPMPIILIGAIGGMLLNGIIGLFVGAVVMAIGYKLFGAWMEQDPAAARQSQPAP